MAEQMTGRQAVTAFLRHDGRVLLVRRSRRVGTYQGRWAGISGFFEGADPLEQAFQEIREETGLSREQVRLVCSAPPMKVVAYDLGTLWVVHPFLFEVADRGAVRLDSQSVAMQWVAPEEVALHHTVPRLADALASCLKRERSSGRA
jgi:8-oxo-dGTP diphosphatase